MPQCQLHLVLRSFMLRSRFNVTLFGCYSCKDILPQFPMAVADVLALCQRFLVMFMRKLCARYSPSITKMLGPQVTGWLIIPSDAVAAIRTSFTKLQTLVETSANLGAVARQLAQSELFPAVSGASLLHRPRKA